MGLDHEEKEFLKDMAQDSPAPKAREREAVPEVSGDVEVQRYDMSGFGDGMIEVVDGAFVYFDDHRAHVTRLTARADKHWRALIDMRDERDALQSELTNARELVKRAAMSDGISQRCPLGRDLAEFLAHQSAPAAKTKQ